MNALGVWGFFLKALLYIWFYSVFFYSCWKSITLFLVYFGVWECLNFSFSFRAFLFWFSNLEKLTAFKCFGFSFYDGSKALFWYWLSIEAYSKLYWRYWIIEFCPSSSLLQLKSCSWSSWILFFKVLIVMFLDRITFFWFFILNSYSPIKVLVLSF